MSLFKKKIRKPNKPKAVDSEEITTNYDQLVFGSDEEQLDYSLAQCCHPIPGDDVFGFITVSNGIKVHKKTCPNAIQLQSNYAYRIIRARWIDSTQEEFRAVIKLNGLDNLGLVRDVTEIISKHMHVDMQSINFTSKESVFEGQIAVKVKNKAILDRLMKRLKEIEGIKQITRE